MSGSAKVLNGLMERRALEAAFSALAETTTLEQLGQSAAAIAEHGNAAIPVLLSFLDTADPQLRGGLGQVASRLDQEQITAALRAAARARDRSDQARLTALMILDRFLHQPVEEDLLAGLQDPAMVAAQSLRELVHEMQTNPFMAIEYLNQLSEQPPDVARTVLEAIPQQPPGPHLITLLRMFAQGEDEGLAQAALEQLSRQRTPAAARALLGLSATLPPPRAALADRSQRKLRLSGVQPFAAGDDEPAHWRALLSPVDGAGAQVVWFVRHEDGQEQGILFSILCKDPEGVVASFGSIEAPAADLPPAQPLGSSYSIQQDAESPAVMLLEVPFDVGKQVVAAALRLNWDGGRWPPMEYRLLNALIWECADEARRPAHDESNAPADECAEDTAAPVHTAALLDHPAFATWFWQAAPLYDAAEQLGNRHSLAARAAQVKALATAHFDGDEAAGYQRRLFSMATWLTLAGQPEAAHLARAAAAELAGPAAAESPLVVRLIGIGLDVAMANLRSGYDLRGARWT